MRKRYPYLQDSYIENENEALERRNFLSKIDSFVNQKRYVKITLLNWQEEPLKEIEGVITGGSMTLDGSSAVRRTCTMTTAVDATSYDIEDADEDFAIDKKIYLEIGIVNYTKEYPEYPVLVSATSSPTIRSERPLAVFKKLCPCIPRLYHGCIYG